MGLSSSQLQPLELVKFKKLPTDVPLDNIEIPERPENRRATNVKWLIFCGIFVAVLFPFLIYSLHYADIQRLIKGYDHCGNICGRNNSWVDDIPCSGRDMTNYPCLDDFDDVSPKNILKSDGSLHHCVPKCRTGFVPIMGRCLKEEKQEAKPDVNLGLAFVKFELKNDVDFAVYFDSVKWQIVISCLLSILVAIGVVLLFRYAVSLVVWSILIGSFIAFALLDAAFCYFYFTSTADPSLGKKDPKNALLSVVVVLSFVTIFFGLIVIGSRAKIRLVILLLRETSKAIFDMPGLITVPVINLFIVLIFTIIAGLLHLTIYSAGTLTYIWESYYMYKSNYIILFTMVYNWVVYVWVCQFCTGIQYMIIAGAISKWYFARNKNYITRPIMTSVSIAFRFHLGTVAFGAFIITLMEVIKAFILGLIRNNKAKAAVNAGVEAIEKFFKFLSKNAYIITAMHGQALIRSGKRASKLIFQNISDIIAINFFGDFVLVMAKLLIIMITIIISMGIFAIAPGSVSSTNIYGYFLITFISAIVAWVSFGVFETTMDTLFICYCEDSLLNDGMARPYFMSRNLREFVESSKAFYREKNKKKDKTEKTEE